MEEGKKKLNLKIIIPIVVVAVIVVIGAIVGISITTGEKNKESDYKSMYTSCINIIDEMNDNSETVTSMVSSIWQEAGPSKISETLASMLLATSENSSIANSYYIQKAFDISSYSSSKAEVYKYAKKYQEAYTQITTKQKTVEEKLKELKEKHNKEHESEIQTLLDYFSKSRSYAQLALEPSGSLMNYNNSKSTLKSEVTELKQKAEFNK